MEEVVVTPTPVVETPTEEKLFAGKYKTAEDLEQGYQELVKKLGQGTPETPPVVTPEPTAAEAAKAAAASVGVDMEALAAEFQEKGELTDETYKALEAKGLPKSLVDKHIDLLQMEATLLQQEVFTSVGGEDNYKSMIEWAATNLNEAEIDEFDKAVGSTKEQIKAAVLGLLTKYQEATGQDPQSLIQGKANAGDDSFQSWAQVTKAMSDPQYQKDPAYRAMIQAKLSKSNL